jgi:hypothetical protein
MINLDRLLHAGPRDARLVRAKVEVLARALRRSASAERTRIDALELSVVEPEGLAQAPDATCSSVASTDPGPGAVLNLVAYAHLVPLVDGGILIRKPECVRWRVPFRA